MTLELGSNDHHAGAPVPPAGAGGLDAAYARIAHIVTPFEWRAHAPIVAEIQQLKRERDAVILAHNYMTPEIFHCVADFVGDSLQLAIEAGRTDAKVIVQGGVHFMAETSKLLNPEKTVIIPDMAAGCSLAESITPADVRALRVAHPGVPIVTYVNTSAAVKAECDVTCTSSNAVRIVEALRAPRVIMVPDEYLARYVATQTPVEIIPWRGHCEVHERFTGAELREYRAANPGLSVIAHPECPPDVISEADFTGSTKGMIDWVKTNRPPKVMLVTECSMSHNVEAEVTGVKFVRPCNFCPHMKRITLPKIRDALRSLEPQVHVPADVARRARAAVERMIALSA